MWWKVTCAQGEHWFQDPASAISEATRLGCEVVATRQSPPPK